MRNLNATSTACRRMNFSICFEKLPHANMGNYNGYMSFASIKLAVASSPKRILSRTESLDFRIPALMFRNGELTLLIDERPHPTEGFDWESLGGAMAADLPNPNRILMMTSPDYGETWGAARPVPGTPRVCGDACIAWDDNGVTLAYAASEKIGYFGSRFEGERLEAWIAYGPDLYHLKHRRADSLYEELRCDGLFATSGSTPMWRGRALLPYVVKTGNDIEIRVVHVEKGVIVDVSESIVAKNNDGTTNATDVFPGENVAVANDDEEKAGAEGNNAWFISGGIKKTLDGPVMLDETTLEVVDDVIYANFRLQGRGGRLMAYSTDGVHFSVPKPWPGGVDSAPDSERAQVADLKRALVPDSDRTQMPDPGCNAKLFALANKGAKVNDELVDGDVAGACCTEGAGGSEVSYSHKDSADVSDDITHDERVARGMETLCLVHPHDANERKNGAIVDISGRVILDIGPGEFGYADIVEMGNVAEESTAFALVFECENSLYFTTFQSRGQ